MESLTTPRKDHLLSATGRWSPLSKTLDLLLKLLKGKWLYNVIITPCLEATSYIRSQKKGGDYQNRDILSVRVGSDHARCVSSTHFRHHDVHENQVGFLLKGFLDTLLAVFGRDDGKPHHIQLPGEDLKQIWIIFHDKDFLHLDPSHRSTHCRL